MDDDQTPTDTSSFGDAAPIMDPIAKAYDKVTSFFKNVPGKSAPPQAANTDTSWHDQKVKEANDSFKPDTATQPTGKTPIQRKALRKAPTKR